MVLHASIDLAHALGEAGCLFTSIPLMELYDVASLFLDLTGELSNRI
jgi:hypothetical protein